MPHLQQVYLTEISLPERKVLQSYYRPLPSLSQHQHYLTISYIKLFCLENSSFPEVSLVAKVISDYLFPKIK